MAFAVAALPVVGVAVLLVFKPAAVEFYGSFALFLWPYTLPMVLVWAAIALVAVVAAFTPE